MNRPYEDVEVYTYVRDFKLPYKDNTPIAHDDPITCMAMEEFLERVRRPQAMFGEKTSPEPKEGMSALDFYHRILEIDANQVGIIIFAGQYSMDGVLTLYWQPHFAFRGIGVDFEKSQLAPRMECEPSELPGYSRITRLITCDLIAAPLDPKEVS